MKYVISRHARDRFRTRFRNRFHQSYFYSDQLTDSLILNLAENARNDNWWEQVPFYKNKIESKYGPTIALHIETKNIYFLCTPLSPGVTIIRTVVKVFDPRLPYGKD